MFPLSRLRMANTSQSRLDVTDLLGKDELIDHQNELVSFKGMTVEAAGQDADGNDVAYLYNYDGSGSEGDDLYFNVSLNGETYTFTVESYLCDKDSDVLQKPVEALNIWRIRSIWKASCTGMRRKPAHYICYSS